MKRRPRNVKKDKLVTWKLLVYSYVYLGIIQSVAGFTMFFIQMSDFGISPGELVRTSGLYFKLEAADFKGLNEAQQKEILFHAQTAFFVGIVLTRIAVLINCRTRVRSVFHQGFRNIPLNVGMLVEITIALVIVHVPGVNTVFGARPLDYKFWLIPLCFSVTLIAMEESRKFLIRNYSKKYPIIKSIFYW